MRRYIVLAALVLAGCASDDGGTPDATPKQTFAPGSSMAEIQQRGVLRVGVKKDVPQFGFLNPTTERFEGFDVDMAAEIAKELGVKPEYTEAISANRIPFLREDKVDIVFSTMTITDQRKTEIDFSDVYYVAGQDLLTKKDKPLTVKTSAGKKVCTAKGSTSEQNLPKLQPGVQILLQDTYGLCVQLLRNDQVDAVSTDDVILLQFAKDDKTLKLTGDPFSREPYGAGIKKGRDDFVSFVNDVIRAMKRDGRWAKLYKTWITPVTGETADPPPADVKFEIIGAATPAP